MKQGYSIRILPVNSIVEDSIADKHAYKKYMQFNRCMPFKILGETFDDIPFGLPIRIRAAQFVACKGCYENQTFAVLYADEKNIQCLFVIRYICGTENFVICRCVSRLAVKRHWEPVREFLSQSSKGTINWKASLNMQF